MSEEYQFHNCVQIHKDDIQERVSNEYKTDISDKEADRIAQIVADRYDLEVPFWTQVDFWIESECSVEKSYDEDEELEEDEE